MESGASMSGTRSGASVACNVVDRANINGGDRSTGNAEARATVSVEARATVNVEARATVNAEDRATVNAGDRSAVNAAARVTVKAEDRATVIAEDCATDNAEDRSAVDTKDYSTVNAEARATANAKERATFNAEARATVKAEDGATVNAEDRATVKAEDGATVNAEDRATVNVEARTTAKAEDRAAVNAETRATANAEAWVTVKDEDRATVNVGDRATVSAEARATVNAEDRATVNVEAWATVKAEDRAIANVEACATVRVEDRLAVNADAEDRSGVNAEARATTVNAETRETFNAEDQSVNAAVRLARSRTLFLELDCTRSERRKHARALARMDPDQKPMEIARRNVERLARLARLRSLSLFLELDCTRSERRKDARALARMHPEQKTLEIARRNVERLARLRSLTQTKRAAEMKRRLSNEVGTIDQDLITCRTSLMNGVCVGGVDIAVARRQEELLARREEALALARMNPQEMLREVGKRNRAKRVAIRHRRCLADELKTVEMDLIAAMDGIATGTSGGLVSAEAIQEELRARREYALALAKMDPQERATEIARKNRAKRIAVRATHRQSRRLADDLKKAEMDLKADKDAVATRTSGGLIPTEATEEELRATRELARALTGMGPQERARGIAKSNRAVRIAVRAIHRQSRRLADDLKKAEMDLKAGISVTATRTSGGLISTEAIQEEHRATGELVRSLAGMDPQERELAKRRRARRAMVCAIQRHRRKTLARGVAKTMSASYAAFFEQERNRGHGVAAEARASGREAEVRQEELGATKEQAHARALAETDHPREIKRETPWRDGAVRVEIRVDQVKERRVPADEANAPSAKKMKLQTGGQALVDGIGTGEVELETGGIASLVDGIGTGEVDGKEAVVNGSMGGSGFCEFPFVEAKQEELREKAMVEVAERLALDAVEAKKKADLTRACRSKKDRRRAEKQERRTSRDGRRTEKLQDRESRAKRKGERSRPAVAVKEEPVRLKRGTVAEEGGGMLAQGARAEEGPLVGIDKRSTAACAAVALVREPFARTGHGQGGISAEETGRGFEASTRSQPGGGRESVGSDCEMR